MKRAYLHSIVYTMITVIVAPLYGQNEKSSFVLQNFTLSDFGDGYDAAKSLVWKAEFSEFAVQVAGAEPATDGQAQLMGGNPDLERNTVRYAENKPDGVSDIVAGGTPQKYVLGVKAEFTRQGYNWIELYPHRPVGTTDPTPDANTMTPAEVSSVADNFLLNSSGAVEAAPDLTVETEPYKIPFSGKALDMTVWVWGGYYGWWIEAYLRDYLGYQYRIPLGDLLYTGWRQKRVGIPKEVIQGSQRLPSDTPVRFEMLKLWSFPSERVDKIYVWFDLLQYNGVVSTEVFNGKELENFVW